MRWIVSAKITLESLNQRSGALFFIRAVERWCIITGRITKRHIPFRFHYSNRHSGGQYPPVFSLFLKAFEIPPEISLRLSEISDIFSKAGSYLRLTQVRKEQSRGCYYQ